MKGDAGFNPYVFLILTVATLFVKVVVSDSVWISWPGTDTVWKVGNKEQVNWLLNKNDPEIEYISIDLSTGTTSEHKHLDVIAEKLSPTVRTCFYVPKEYVLDAVGSENLGRAYFITAKCHKKDGTVEKSYSSRFSIESANGNQPSNPPIEVVPIENDSKAPEDEENTKEKMEESIQEYPKPVIIQYPTNPGKVKYVNADKSSKGYVVASLVTLLLMCIY